MEQSPNEGPRADSNSLSGVYCTSDDACMAVGDYGSGLDTDSLAESWDGTNWSIVPSRNESQASVGADVVQGVSCSSGSMCVAVGYYATKGYVTKALIEA